MSTYNDIEKALFDDDGIKITLEETEYNKAVAYSSKYIKGGKTFASSSDVYEVIKPYLTEKIKEKNTLTDTKNNIEFHGVNNALYIDIDYKATITKFKNVDKEIEKYNKNIARLYLNAFINSYEGDENDYYYFAFIPNDFKKEEEKFKGGVHILVYINKSLKDTEKNKIYNDMIEFCNNNYEEEKIDTSIIINEDNEPNIFKYIFDKGPIKSGNVLCPFGQKERTSRQYKLYKTDYNGQNWFLLDEYQNKRNKSDITNEDISRKAVRNINILKSSKIRKMKIEDEEDSNEEASGEYEEDNENKHSEEDEEDQSEDNNEGDQEEEDSTETFENDTKLIEYEKIFSESSKIVFEFIKSLKYLSDNHSLWKIIISAQNHNEYYKTILFPCIEICIIYNILNAQDEREFETYYEDSNRKARKRTTSQEICAYIRNDIVNEFVTLCKYEQRDISDKNNRYDYNEQLKNIKQFLYIPFYNSLFKEDTTYYNDANIDKPISPVGLYYMMKNLYKFNFDNKTYLKTFENPDTVKYHLRVWRTFTQIVSRAFKDFSLFVSRIKDDITNEIEPFNMNKSYLNQYCYKDNSAKNGYKERITFYDVEPDFDITNGSKKRIEDNNINSEYSKTLSLWIRVILTIRYYENNFQLQGAITETLGAFIKQYICIIHTSSSSNKQGSGTKILLYNIRQTKDLESYPYNQWISDNNKNMINQWITKLYNSYIKTALYTTEKNKSIAALLQPFVDCKIIENRFCVQKIAPLPHAERDITEMVNNIIKVHPTESSNIPKYIPIETSPIFPMRNGWLYFKSCIDNADAGIFDKDDTEYIKFIENNKEDYTNSTTNVIWVGNEQEYKEYIEQSEHKEQKAAYKAISKMINEIYPPIIDEETGKETYEERDYNMKLFASVLYGCGTKDILHILFGTGSDGKTTIINALFGMLDAAGFTSNVSMIDNGRYIQINATQGLASTMKAETLLLTNNNVGGHDEGGRACIAHMRLVNVQEPDQNQHHGQLNGATIKELTSCSAISARKIYGESESVQANALITFQTNFYPGTDDNTTGFKRRLSVYKHRAKFITQSNTDDDKKNDNYAFHYIADPSLNDAVMRNIYYKQAMFYYLLPYAIDNLKNGRKSLQNVPKPKSVVEEIEKVIANSTGASDWIRRNIIDCSLNNKYDSNDIENKYFGIISVNSLIEYMKRVNKNSSDVKLWNIKNSKSETDMLATTIQNMFERCIFKLKNEFYTTKSRGKTKIIMANNKNLNNFIRYTDIEFNEDCTVKNSAQAYKKCFLEKSASNDIHASYLTDFSDMFICGYRYINSKDDEDNDEMDRYESNSSSENENDKGKKKNKEENELDKYED